MSKEPWYESDDPGKLARGASWRIFLYIAIAVFAIGGIGLGYAMVFRPAFMEVDREVQQNSPQYVESQRTFMLQKLDAIRELQAEIIELQAAAEPNQTLINAKQAQIIAFTNELKQRAEMIDESEIPESVQEYLDEVERENRS